MGQSLNLYLAEPSGRKLSEMYLLAWERAEDHLLPADRRCDARRKSTLDVNRRGIQPRWMKNKSASSNIKVERGPNPRKRAASSTQPAKAASNSNPSSAMKIFTHNLGFPRVGPKRELKRALEGFWSGKTTEADLQATAKATHHQNWLLQKSLGIDFIPSNDFSFYDHVVDTCALVGGVPSRFRWHGGNVGLDTYFAMARGVSAAHPAVLALRRHRSAGAMEMTKWLDTNYHYLVPEFRAGQTFQLASTKPFDGFQRSQRSACRPCRSLLGPVSFLLLGKSEPNFDRLTPAGATSSL